MNPWKRKYDSDIQKARVPEKEKDLAQFKKLLAEFNSLMFSFRTRSDSAVSDAIEEAKQSGSKEVRINLDPALRIGLQALEVADEMIVLVPRRAIPWTCRCLALGALARLNEALTANEQAIEIDPSDPEKWALHASILERLNRKEEAKEAREEEARLR